MTITLRPATPEDIATLVALNDAVVAVTSPMDADQMRALMQIAAHCVVAEHHNQIAGFVLAMQMKAPYANGNFSWFGARLNNFIYVDRIVIADEGRGQGLGKRLYDHIATQARAAGNLVMAAEMDLDPPNHGSLKFYAQAGFFRLGTRALDSGKVVSMQVKGL